MRLLGYTGPVLGLLTFCFYVLVWYSCMRTCMEDEKKRDAAPGLPVGISFLIGALWPLFLFWVASVDLVKGIKEQLGKR